MLAPPILVGGVFINDREKIMKVYAKYILSIVCGIFFVLTSGTTIYGEETNYTQVETYNDVEYKESLDVCGIEFSVYDYSLSLNKKGNVKLEWYDNYFLQNILFIIIVFSNIKSLTIENALKITSPAVTLHKL